MKSSFTLLRVRGIPIGVNWSWLVIFGLVVWSLSQALFPATYPGFSGTTYVFMALAAAGLFFASVLLHELGHALRALREGMSIRGITLWMFGGVAQLAGSPPSPRAEFHVAICGPVVSLLLGVGFLGGAWVGDELGWPGTVQGVVDYLGRINLLVLGFNLIPALPLDGGRVLRSWLWRRQRSFIAATRSAARVGQAFGWMLVAIGILGLFGGQSGFGGLWFAVIGWFLIQAARSEAEQAVIHRALGDLKVRDLMRPLRDGTGDAHGAPSPPSRPPSALHATTVEADRPVYEAVGTLGEIEGGVGVTEQDRRVGVLYAADVTRALEEGMSRPQQEEPARKAGVLVWLVVGSIIAVAGAALYHPPYAVVSPGDAIEVGDGIEIDGVPVDELDSRYLLTTVSIGRRSALRTLWAALGGEHEIIPVDDLFPSGVPLAEYARIQRRVFQESRQVAAAASARAVGLPVTVTGSGARVVDVADGSPAEGVLRAGDVVVSVEGEGVDTAAAFANAIRARPAGTELELVIERDDTRRSVSVTSEERADLAGRVGIGVLIDTRGLDVDLPFEVNFPNRGDIGGPSAGLAYALALADLLDERDFGGGRTIAATGTIALDGDVGAVGGVEQKAVAVADAGADVFFVPEQEIGEVSGEELTVRGVSDLAEALSFLRAGA